MKVVFCRNLVYFTYFYFTVTSDSVIVIIFLHLFSMHCAFVSFIFIDFDDLCWFGFYMAYNNWVFFLLFSWSLYVSMYSIYVCVFFLLQCFIGICTQKHKKIKESARNYQAHVWQSLCTCFHLLSPLKKFVLSFFKVPLWCGTNKLLKYFFQWNISIQWTSSYLLYFVVADICYSRSILCTGTCTVYAKL